MDAVTKSTYAMKLGFRISYMEQLCRLPAYQRNPLTDEYNPRYITQLTKNYRSHPRILAIPNALFYDNKLEAKAPEGNCLLIKETILNHMIDNIF